MKLTVVDALSLGDAWYQCLQKALFEGREYVIQQGSFEGVRRKEIELVAINITKPGIRPLSPDVPTGVPMPTTDENIEEYMSYLMTAEKQENEEYTYGEFLTPQIEEIIRRYKKGYDTNQMCMCVGSKDSIYQADPPCFAWWTRVSRMALCTSCFIFEVGTCGVACPPTWAACRR